MSDDAREAPGRTKPVAVSIEQLLEAEQAAERQLADAKRQAAELIEEAYKEAQAIDHGAAQRIERLSHKCREADDRLAGDIEAEANAFRARPVETSKMQESLRAAVEALAARLTGGTP